MISSARQRWRPAADHVRRYRVFYALVAVWALMAALLPTLQPTLDSFAGASGRRGRQVTAADGAEGGAPTDVGGVTDAPLGATGAAAAAAKAGGAKAGGTAAGGAATQLAGKTRGGFDCRPGVKQIPDSDYAPPCVPLFTGGNGGANWRGVTATKVRIADRIVSPTGPTGQAISDFAARSGDASGDVERQVQQVFLDYFNKTFELYGRQVEIVPYKSQHGDSVNESTNNGRPGACADATDITDDVGAFGVVWSDSDPFQDCAAERKLMVFDASSQAPESFYAARYPYLWSGYQDCTRLAYQAAEYLGKRLVGRPAHWAGDAGVRTRTRKFGIYMPDDDVYGPCLDLFTRLMRENGGGDVSVYKYRLDVARLADQSQQAVLQFKGAGVTSVVLACDSISVQFLTQGAAAQSFRPEWVLSGVANTDFDGSGRQYEQSEVDGHMFGRSQTPRQWRFGGPDSEPGRLYKRLTGRDIPQNALGNYYGLLLIFTMLQEAGPILTPAAIGAGVASIPERNGPVGLWSFSTRPDGAPGSDHSALDDNEEVYWDGSALSRADGGRGSFVPTYGERRFRNGEWPLDEPPIYPGR